MAVSLSDALEVDQLFDQFRDFDGESGYLKVIPEAMACVREGAVELLRETLEKPAYNMLFERRADQAFPIGLALTSGMLMRCAWEGGLPLEEGYLISGKYIQASFGMTDISELIEALHAMHIEFAEKVREKKTYVSENSVVHKCAGYITVHASQKIDLDELASFCGYSLNGLQHLFKRCTGLTLTECIRKEKVSRAKLLLERSDDSCLSISNQLSFCSQSHFVTQFKRETGMTPSQYRKATV
ncbi:MAG: AraC family transcriptional regulator [Eggerthellaceae bacterium]|nr:AraC family transcriptional regulator [Eggerthellaceae bacterium]MDR2715897.1 AraC family transcriptional regulator [Coriobacteriaceae bacterium]